MEAEDLLEPSLFEQMMAEAVEPLSLALGGQVWEIRVPDSDAVCALDELTRPADILGHLLGDDLADDVLDVLDTRPWSLTLSVTAEIRRHFALAPLPRGMWTDIVEQIDLYGEAIESDLADRGWDLLDWFRGRRPWTQLARLLARMPEGSRYQAAVLDDEDLALARIQAEDDDPPPRSGRPPLVGETQDRMLLRAIASQLLRIEHAVYASQVGKKAGRPPRALPGPQTAEERVRERLADQDVEEIFDAVTPGWRREPEPDPGPPPAGYAASKSGLYLPR